MIEFTVFLGIRDTNGCKVRFVRNGRVHQLPLRLNLRNHSPDGFEWGYGGSGPSQLALSLLYEVCGMSALTLELYQEFKGEIVGRLEKDAWVLTSTYILDWIARKKGVSLPADAPQEENADGRRGLPQEEPLG